MEYKDDDDGSWYIYHHRYNDEEYQDIIQTLPKVCI